MQPAAVPKARAALAAPTPPRKSESVFPNPAPTTAPRPC